MFTKGQAYQRSEIHDMYGGQKVGIISTPQKQSFVLIFADESVEGDGLNESGEYLLTGEGKTGDMKFARGNKAIRDHVKDSKKLYLFKLAENQGEVEFLGEAIYKDYITKKGLDKGGNERDCIVMKLQLADVEHITTEDVVENAAEENDTVEKIAEEQVAEENIQETVEEKVEESIQETVEAKVEENIQQTMEEKIEENKKDTIEEKSNIGLKGKLATFFSRFKKK